MRTQARSIAGSRIIDIQLTSNDTLPLLPDTDDHLVLAWRDLHPITRGEFLQEVLALAERLPQTGHILNLCRDRYWFALSLFAAIVRNILSVLPHSTATDNLALLSDQIPEAVCVYDGAQPPCVQLPCFRVTDVGVAARHAPLPMPQIRVDQPVVCVYTSGSTGAPQPHVKTFGRIRQSVLAEADRLWSLAGGPCAVVGTVPFQHMYGLESTVLLPLLGGGQLSARKPFFALDVVMALAALPVPRLLVSTPFHLRQLLSAGVQLPPLAAVLSATAPLSRELAVQIEQCLSAPLIEIYGATETGQIATRQPTQQQDWEVLSGISLCRQQGATVADGGHLECAQVLNDRVELVSPYRFRLLGRNADMINIAGKRNSLAFLNHILTHLPGVSDGVFCMLDSGVDATVNRLAAFVVAPAMRQADILSALQTQVDPVFLPRPIVLLHVLPRNENGKITANTLAKLVAEHITSKMHHVNHD